jgi:hypothetical protein
MTIDKIEVLIRLISGSGAIFISWKIIYDIVTGGKPRLREDYRFAKEFLEELKNNPDLHPFAVEKGYHAIAGSNTVGFEEIAYLLSLKNPGQCLYDYTFARRILQTIDKNGELYLTFSKKYSSSQFRWLKKNFHLLCYLFWAVMSICPGFLSALPLWFLVITLPIFGYASVDSIRSYARIRRGEELVKNQQNHTHRILLPPM